LYAADMFRKVGLVFYPEQFFAAMFGLAGALAYLAVPAGKGREREGRPVPWYDIVAAAITFAGWTYVAVYYPVLSEISTNFPIGGILTAAVVIALLLEGLRRTAGTAITIVVVGFLTLAMVSYLLPGALTGRPVDLDRLLYYLTWDSTAILGTPLKIVSTVVVAFILFGQALFLSGGSGFFTDISMVVMGKYRGGPGKIAIVASSLFGTISGSVVANVVSTGVVTIPLMKQAGYRPHIAGAIEAVASTGGQLMPPVMGIAAFIMAEFLQVSYASVCIAAVIPSLLFYAALFIEADLEAGRYGISRVAQEKIPPALLVLKNGWHFSVPFIALISAIFWYNYPLEESALIAVVIVVVLSMTLGYRGERLRPKVLIEILKTTGTSVLEIFMIGAAAGIVIGVLNISGLGFGLTLSLIQLAGGSLILLLILAAIVSIILGMGMPTVGVYILLATLVAPALIQMKIDPMAAHLFILYYGMMSMITPPVAIGAFAAATLSGADAMRTGFAAMRFGWTAFVIPFLYVYSGTLILRGKLVYIILDVAAAIFGVWFVSAAMIGYTMRTIGMLYRGLFAVAGLSLLIPMGLFGGGRYVNIFGACLGTILLFVEFSARRRRRAAQSK
ncbi:MAG: TRAP transporter fused permease subunit, partial [Patescibacteria group bacterium]